MSNTFQTIVIIIIAGIAVTFLVKKFIWSPNKKSNSKSCGNNGCGC